MSSSPGTPAKPLHDPISPPERDPPSRPMHDPPGDPTFEPSQPVTEPTPNPASDPPPEMPVDRWPRLAFFDLDRRGALLRRQDRRHAFPSRIGRYQLSLVRQPRTGWSAYSRDRALRLLNSAMSERTRHCASCGQEARFRARFDSRAGLSLRTGQPLAYVYSRGSEAEARRATMLTQRTRRDGSPSKSCGCLSLYARQHRAAAP
jgi:hypothetical protein